MLGIGFHVVSRLRRDAALYYAWDGKPTGKPGHPRKKGEKIGEENLCRYEGSAVQYACVTETRKPSSGSFLTEYRYRQHGFHSASVTYKTFHNRDILFPFTDNSYLDGLAASKTVYRTADGQHSVSVRDRYGYDIIEPSPFVFCQKALSLQNIYSDGGSMEKAVDKYYYGTYELVSAMVLPTETRTVSYSPTGRDSVVAVSSQSYSRSYSHAIPVSLESYNSVSGRSHTSSCAFPDAALLQNGGLQCELSCSTVTTFTFDGVNGVATVIDINGVVSSYAYDDFGLLLSAISSAVNASGSVEKAIKETYKYNYKH